MLTDNDATKKMGGPIGATFSYQTMLTDAEREIERLKSLLIEKSERESLHDRRVRLIEKGMEIYGMYFLARHKDTDNYTIQIHILEDVAKIWADAVIAATGET